MISLLTKFGWPAIVVVLLLVIVGQKVQLNHKDNVIGAKELIITESAARYEEEIRMLDIAKEKADYHAIIHKKEQEVLSREVVPEDCEAAIEWMIKQSQNLK